MDVRVGLQRKLSAKELMSLSCGIGEDSWESLGLQGDQIFTGRTDAEAAAPILWPPDMKNWLTGKDPDAGKDWRQEGKGMTRWDGWMASPTQWTWISAGSESWWWTGKPGVLQSMGLQRVAHVWVMELNWTELPAVSEDGQNSDLIPPKWHKGFF